MKKRNKYRSKFEARVAKLLPKATYEKDEISYTSEHTYIPDFTEKEGNTIIYYECKGRFRTRSEASKYIDVRTALEQKRLKNPLFKFKFIFIFQNPNTPMPGAKKRLDGTKQTMAEWADKNKFKWMTM